jgi:uncharacterized protein
MPDGSVDTKLMDSITREWNSWSPPNPHIERETELRAIESSLLKNNLTLVCGVRGVGKSTLLHQTLHRLQSKNKNRSTHHFIDTENPTFYPSPDKEQLERSLLARLSPSDPSTHYLFIDEVGRFGDWENWLSQLVNLLPVKIVASLSGHPPKNLTSMGMVNLLPLCIKDIPTDTSSNTENILDDYLTSGGIPSLIFGGTTRESIIQYLNNILFSEIVSRHEVREPKILTDLAVDILKNTSRPISATSIKGRFTRSIDQARSFLELIQASGLIHLVERWEDDGRPAQSSRRAFSVDSGLSHILSGGTTPKKDLAETAVLLALRRMGAEIRAWRIQENYGLLVFEDTNPILLLQVIYANAEINHRKTLKAMQETNCKAGLILSLDPSVRTLESKAGTLSFLPLLDWLMNPSVTRISTGTPVGRKTSSTIQSPVIQRHLL